MGFRRLRSFVGAHARELLLLMSTLGRRNDQPTLLVLPSQSREDGASNLRGYLIAEQLRRVGWNAYTCHKNLRLNQRLRVINFLRPAAILMQMARHPLNRPSHYQSVPVVFDIDDADYVDDRQRANVIKALENSAAVIAGSRAVARFCQQHNANVHVVWTGTPVSTTRRRPQADRPPIVAWAALYPSHCPAEADFLLDVLKSLKERTSDFQFLLYCDDGSAAYYEFSGWFRALGVDVITRPFISDYSEFLASLEDVAVGLAPLVDVGGFSGGKSFGKVLAYMDRGVPIVTHPVVDHPVFFKTGINGYMVEEAKVWAEVIARLLANPIERQQVADAAHGDLERRLSTREAAARVDTVLRSVVRDQAEPGPKS
jgi:glycosyltransferase involved in cell wall biosynthesis